LTKKATDTASPTLLRMLHKYHQILLSKQTSVSLQVTLDGALTNEWLVTQERDRLHMLEELTSLRQRGERERDRAEAKEEEAREIGRKYAIAMMNVKEGQERERAEEERVRGLEERVREVEVKRAEVERKVVKI